MSIDHHETHSEYRYRDLFLRVRIVRKFAEILNGVNLTKVRAGDCVDMPARDARMLIAEGWAELVDPHPREISAGGTITAR